MPPSDTGAAYYANLGKPDAAAYHEHVSDGEKPNGHPPGDFTTEDTKPEAHVPNSTVLTAEPGEIPPPQSEPGLPTSRSTPPPRTKATSKPPKTEQTDQDWQRRFERLEKEHEFLRSAYETQGKTIAALLQGQTELKLEMHEALDGLRKHICDDIDDLKKTMVEMLSGGQREG